MHMAKSGQMAKAARWLKASTASTKKKRTKATKRCENIFGINFSKTWQADFQKDNGSRQLRSYLHSNYKCGIL